MTREEAANVLWWASKQHYPGDQMDITEYDIEAFDIAIAALRGPKSAPMTDKRYPTRMHEVLGVETEERFTHSEYGDRKFWLSESGLMYRICDDGTSIPTTQGTLVLFINHPERIIRKPRPGCWHCWNIEAHKIEYVTAVKDKDGRPMNTPTDIPYRYCPSCGRKLGVEG